MNAVVKLTHLLLLAMLWSCTSSEPGSTEPTVQHSGKLFIIGGGHRPPSLIQSLIDFSTVDSTDYIVVLPMSSSEPDTSAYYAAKQFYELGIEHVVAFNFEEKQSQAWRDSLEQAKLIYITGGDQNKFMRIAEAHELLPHLHKAYRNGATIAGTSAGAAMMSANMITGDEKKHPVYTGEFRSIEADNIELKAGLGLLQSAIIDQHFIKRMRMNRLISVALEHPGQMAVGIDESTAIAVSKGQATVKGVGQVVVMQYNDPEGAKTKDGLLGGNDIQLSILLPGDQFAIK